jgi:hypothetical protein
MAEGALSELLRFETLVELDIDPKENDDRSLRPDERDAGREREAEDVDEMDALRECERLCLWPVLSPPESAGGATLPSLNESNLCLIAKSSCAASTAVAVEGRSTANIL